MIFHPQLERVHTAWLFSHGYGGCLLLAQGRSAGVWKIKKGSCFFAAKIEHEKSRRLNMLEKEARHLCMANQIGIGPTVHDVDLQAGILVMDFVDGIPLARWLLACDSKMKMEKVLQEVFRQAQKLDAAGIDHGQLGGKLHNILVGAHEQVFIIDFEKAGYVRKVRNVRKLRAVLFHSHTSVVEKVRGLLGTGAEFGMME